MSSTATQPEAAALSDADVRDATPALHAHARRAVGDAAVAADLVQETLLAAVSGAAPFEGRSRLRTWLISILSHKIVDHLRRAGRWRTTDVDDASPEDLLAPASSRSPERVLARRQAMEIVQRALPDLPPRERMAVLLVDVEGTHREEVCNVLEVQPTHLRILLHRGRHRLRKALEHAGMSRST